MVVRGNENAGFLVAPLSTEEEVFQNVRMILRSRQYEIPLARGLGIDPNIEGRPLAIAETLTAQSISDAVEEYEPRAVIKSIDFEVDHDTGTLVPMVEVSVGE